MLGDTRALVTHLCRNNHMSQNILLVDDDPLITEPLARALKTAGYAVEVAHAGPQGLTLALGGGPNAKNLT